MWFHLISPLQKQTGSLRVTVVRERMRGEAGSIKRIPYLQKYDKAVITSIFLEPVLVPELAAAVYLYGCM